MPQQQPIVPQQPIYATIPEDEPQVIRYLWPTRKKPFCVLIVDYRDWREKQQAEIRARDEASKIRREETIDKAERAIEEFYENYSKKKERNIRDNKCGSINFYPSFLRSWRTFPINSRNSESEYLSELSVSLSTGTTWERICNLIELQNSQSKTIARTGAGTTDLTRFKEVLLRLKREGDAAPGAGGY